MPIEVKYKSENVCICSNLTRLGVIRQRHDECRIRQQCTDFSMFFVPRQWSLLFACTSGQKYDLDLIFLKLTIHYIDSSSTFALLITLEQKVDSTKVPKITKWNWVTMNVISNSQWWLRSLWQPAQLYYYSQSTLKLYKYRRMAHIVPTLKARIPAETRWLRTATVYKHGVTLYFRVDKLYM